MTLGQFIAAKRSELGLTTTELAERAGVSHAYISMLEHGRRKSPSPSTLDSLARALGVPVAKLEALIEVNSGEVDRLRVVVRNSRKTMAKVPKLVADIEEMLALLDSPSADSHRQSWDCAGQMYDEPKQFLVADLDQMKFVKLTRELQELNRSLPPLLETLANTLQYPRYPEPIEDLIFRASRLGDDGLGFFAQIVDATEKLMGVSSSEKDRN